MRVCAVTMTVRPPITHRPAPIDSTTPLNSTLAPGMGVP